MEVPSLSLQAVETIIEQRLTASDRQKLINNITPQVYIFHIGGKPFSKDWVKIYKSGNDDEFTTYALSEEFLNSLVDWYTDERYKKFHKDIKIHEINIYKIEGTNWMNFNRTFLRLYIDKKKLSKLAC